MEGPGVGGDVYREGSDEWTKMGGDRFSGTGGDSALRWKAKEGLTWSVNKSDPEMR